jgi:prepilin-type N-terminal cleavage/methylation domain-containing protein
VTPEERMHGMSRQRTPGFTLVELLVVIAIVAILAAITVPVFMNIDRSGKLNACMNNLRALGVALAEYHEDWGAYPAAPDWHYLRSAGAETDYLPFTPQVATPIVYTGSAPSTAPEAMLTVTGATSPPTKFLVKIDATGLPDGFRYSIDNGTTWLPAGPLPIPSHLDPTDPTKTIVDPQALGTTGVSVTFGTEINHAVNDQWEFWVNENGLMTTTDQTPRFGLAVLYWLYLGDRGDYVNGRNRFHCPMASETLNVDMRANITAEIDKYPGDANLFTFDPLWGGFNTYDVTYNYDQFNPSDEDGGTAEERYIDRFDDALGFGNGNRARQLRNPKAPPDTVVCWCYQHRSAPTLSYPLADPTNPDLQTALPGGGLTPAAAARLNARLINRANASRRGDRDLVLWVDGTVAAMRPYLAQAKDPIGTESVFYWVPPFLMTPEGGER